MSTLITPSLEPWSIDRFAGVRFTARGFAGTIGYRWTSFNVFSPERRGWRSHAYLKSCWIRSDVPNVIVWKESDTLLVSARCRQTVDFEKLAGLAADFTEDEPEYISILPLSVRLPVRAQGDWPTVATGTVRGLKVFPEGERRMRDSWGVPVEQRITATRGTDGKAQLWLESFIGGAHENVRGVALANAYLPHYRRPRAVFSGKDQLALLAEVLEDLLCWSEELGVKGLVLDTTPRSGILFARTVLDRVKGDVAFDVKIPSLMQGERYRVRLSPPSFQRLLGDPRFDLPYEQTSWGRLVES